jgi:hypothetical protein
MLFKRSKQIPIQTGSCEFSSKPEGKGKWKMETTEPLNPLRCRAMNIL